MKVVAFLQNAWSPSYAGRRWPRASWLRALGRSRSGARLANLTASAATCEFWFDNTTPEVGASPDSCPPYDPAHMLAVLTDQKPDAVVALGRQAAVALAAIGWRGPLLVVPHPTYRVVTNRLYARAGAMLSPGFRGRAELKQLRGRVLRIPA